MSNEGPKYIQTEPTMPSVQAHKLVAPEVREAYLTAETAKEAAFYVLSDDEFETLEACPVCANCSACRGSHAVTPSEAVAIRAEMEKQS